MEKLKLIIPPSLRYFLKKCRGLLYFIMNGRSWLTFASQPIPKNSVRVCYGHTRLPRYDEPIHGGLVKSQWLEQYFPNSPTRFNILYLASSALPPDWLPLSRLAGRKGAKLVLNQNGVLYPAQGPHWEEMNRPLKTLVGTADYVFYQSRFCKDSADRFLGERSGSWEILYNAVDTNIFTPGKYDVEPKDLTLILGGTQIRLYRLETALKALAILAKEQGGIRLLITGKLLWDSNEASNMRTAQKMVASLGIEDRVEFLGPYSQLEAPNILRRGHILLHTMYNDACPGIVIEAMACGLPVVYSKSGGVFELVGDEAGIGLAAELNWQEAIPPDPKGLAQAVLQVAEDRKRKSEAARQRAVEKFDLRPWIKRHKEVIEYLLG